MPGHVLDNLNTSSDEFRWGVSMYVVELLPLAQTVRLGHGSLWCTSRLGVLVPAGHCDYLSKIQLTLFSNSRHIMTLVYLSLAFFLSAIMVTLIYSRCTF